MVIIKESNNVRRENSSAIFLIPALELKLKLKQRFYHFGFINSYLFCDREDCAYDKSIIPLFLLFKPDRFDAEFAAFTLDMQNNANYLETKDFSGGRVMFVFKIPDKFKKDYELFLKGKYSKFSDVFKSCFLMTEYVKDEEGNLIKEGKTFKTEYTTFYHIFNKTEQLRNKWLTLIGEDTILPDDIDLYNIYNEQEETFTH